MSIAQVSDLVSELTKTATLSLDEAIKKGIAGGNQTLRDVRVWWIKEERVSQGSPSGYQVNMMIGFVIDD
jgi:flavin-binding protein dodecin